MPSTETGEGAVNRKGQEKKQGELLGECVRVSMKESADGGLSEEDEHLRAD